MPDFPQLEIMTVSDFITAASFPNPDLGKSQRREALAS